MISRSGLPVLLAGASLFLLSACSSPPEASEPAFFGPRPGREFPRPNGTGAGVLSPETMELAACVRVALSTRPELAVAEDEWRAATERIARVSTLPEPKLTYAEALEEVQTRTGAQERRFGLSQAFPWPGQLSQQGRVAERQAAAEERRLASLRLEVAAEVEVAFHDYALLARELSITSELLELLRGLEPVVQGRVRTGGRQEDLLRLQVELGRLEDDLASLERHRPARSSRLAEAMGLATSAGEVLDFPAFVEPMALAVDVAAAQREAEENNPRLDELEERSEASREAARLARYRRKPSFSLGVEYISTDASVDPSVAGRGDDPVLLGLTVALPIWGSSYSAGEREARYLERAARRRIEVGRSEIRAEVEEQAFVVDDAARRFALYRDSLIPRASEALELTLASYRTGATGVLDLIDAERALLEFELSYWRAGAEWLKGEARLRALRGEVSQ